MASAGKGEMRIVEDPFTADSERGKRVESLPGILLTLSVELAPPIRAGLQAQLQ